MENKIRFRNHISIVAERMGSIFLFLFFALMGGFAQNLKTIAKKDIRLDADFAEVWAADAWSSGRHWADHCLAGGGLV